MPTESPAELPSPGGGAFEVAVAAHGGGHFWDKPGVRGILVQKRILTGHSFSISHLILARGWAEFHGLHMVVELDHSTDDNEYEEILLFYAGWSLQRCGMVWCEPTQVVVQPAFGRERRFDDFLEALESLVPITDSEISKIQGDGNDDPSPPSPAPGADRPALHSSRPHRPPPLANP